MFNPKSTPSANEILKAVDIANKWLDIDTQLNKAASDSELSRSHINEVFLRGVPNEKKALAKKGIAMIEKLRK